MSHPNKPRRGNPFYIGQPHDEVVYVCKRTGRRRKSMRVLAVDGTPMADTENVNLGDDLTIEIVYTESTYLDLILMFKRGRLPDGTGALCYRVTEITNEAPSKDSLLTSQSEPRYIVFDNIHGATQ